MTKLMNISELSKSLNLINPKSKKPLNHVIRYWEKEFKQIRPKKINNRRYYSSNQIKLIKLIKFLLRNKGLTISGVKAFLKKNTNELDYANTDSLKTEYYKISLKQKSLSLLKKISNLKIYGKKNSH